MPAKIFADGDQDYIEKFNTVAQQAFDGDAAAGRLDDHIDGTADKHGASAIVNTPAGGIAATDVQAAINELDTEKQPKDATLTAFAALTIAADKLPYGNGSDTFGTTDLTSAGRALLDDADASAQRATLAIPVVSSADFASLAAAVTSVIASGKALLIGPSETATINVPSDVSTIQGAINLVRNWIVAGGGQVVIQLADGTYTAGGILWQPLGNMSQGVFPLTIQGNSGTPGNVIVSVTSTHAFQAYYGATVYIKDMELRTTTAGSCLSSVGGAFIAFNNIRFGACATTHIECLKGGVCEAYGDYAITGGGVSHMHVAHGGRIFNNGNIVTLTGTPSFSAYFIGVAAFGLAQCIGQTYTGSATGARFLVHNGGFIELGNVSGAYTDPASSTYFPGDVAGYCNPSTGGFYDYIKNGFVSATFLSPLTSDGAALGSSTKMWSDLFLASGGVINWSNGAVTLTHGTNTLALSGASLNVAGAIGANGAGVICAFQAKTDTDLAIRMLSSSGVNLIDGVNLAQNAYRPIRLSGSTSSLAASNTDHVTVNGTRVVMGSPVGLKSYTVATLPTGAAGDFAYASDGRKNGEGAAAGTGVPVFKDGSAWRAVDTGATVAA